MIKPVLRYLHSPDAPDLNSYVPEHPEEFGLLVQAMIGPSDQHGEEAFDFLVCTPAWLSKRLALRGPEFGRHYLFVDRYDPQRIGDVFNDLCASISGPDWATVAALLSRYGKWEFEDYTDIDP